MKKIVSIIFTISILISTLIFPVTAKSAELRYGDYKYKVVNNEVEITDYVGKSKKLSIPEQIDGKIVTTIGYLCFGSSNKYITSVTIPDTVTVIKEEAFWQTNIKSVLIGKNVKTIENRAFAWNLKLKKITVKKGNKYFSSQKGVLYNKKKTKLIQYPLGNKRKKYAISKYTKTINKYAFAYGEYPQQIVFNKKLNKIDKNAFYANSGIKSLKLNKKLKSIGQSAFENCHALKKIYLPENIRQIGFMAFCKCTKLSKLIFKGNKKLRLNGDVFEGCYKLKKVTVPKVKTSCGGTFMNCLKIKEIKIPKNIKTIFSSDFLGCRSLKTVTIPRNVNKIERHAFGYYYYERTYKYKGFTIKGYKGTAAEKYAKKNGFKFIALD